LATLDEEDIDQHLYISFAKFETRLKEYDRARVIYKYALDHLPKDKTKNLYKEYTQFEKQFGQKDGIEDVILQKRRIKYEEVFFFFFFFFFFFKNIFLFFFFFFL